MTIEHVVEPGECISSIADKYGHFWSTVWDCEENAGLRERCGDPNTLIAGETVIVPDLRSKEEVCEPGRRHRFRKKGIPCFLRVQLLDGELPRVSQTCRVDVDGAQTTETTDENGVLEIKIEPASRRVLVVFEEDDTEYDLTLGAVPPISTLEGIQIRLRNLGFRCPAHGELCDETREALTRFQRRFELDPTGEPDDPTTEKLTLLHDTGEPHPEPPAEQADG